MLTLLPVLALDKSQSCTCVVVVMSASEHSHKLCSDSCDQFGFLVHVFLLQPGPSRPSLPVFGFEQVSPLYCYH